MERMTRKACTVFGSLGRDLQGAAHRRAKPRNSSCLHTATKAIRIGRPVQAARAATGPVAAVVKRKRACRVFRGKVTDVLRRATEGWLRGTVVIEGLDANRGETLSRRLPERVVGRLAERRGAASPCPT